MPLHLSLFTKEWQEEHHIQIKEYTDFSTGLLIIFQNTEPSSEIILFENFIKICIY